jgi:hypothetical protein
VKGGREHGAGHEGHKTAEAGEEGDEPFAGLRVGIGISGGSGGVPGNLFLLIRVSMRGRENKRRHTSRGSTGDAEMAGVSSPFSRCSSEGVGAGMACESLCAAIEVPALEASLVYHLYTLRALFDFSRTTVYSVILLRQN